MIKRMFGAVIRALAMAMVIAMPALLLPDVSSDTTQIVALLSLLAAVLTFIEYISDFPSLIEFRSAPPFNRLRFLSLLAIVLCVTLLARHETAPSLVTALLTLIGSALANTMDFPFSPIRLMSLLAPGGAPEVVDQIRNWTAVAYLIALCTLATFVMVVRVLDWPIHRGAFNFWVNLPLFDPTVGGDVLKRLKRDSNINIALGFVLPFLIPAILKLASGPELDAALLDPQSLTWIVAAWAFLPVSLIMRGIALLRIAELIEEKRRRAYSQTELQLV